MDFIAVLRLLPAVGPVVAALPEFKKVYEQLVATFSSAEQADLKAAYADLIADNDAGHARLQEKLARASGA